MKRMELPLSQQIVLSSRGPVSDAHLNILLELEKYFPENAGNRRKEGERLREWCK